MVKTYNSEELTKLLAIHAAATKGEWKVGYDGSSRPIISLGYKLFSWCRLKGSEHTWDENEDNDTKAIVSAHEALPNLIAQVERLNGYSKTLDEELVNCFQRIDKLTKQLES